MEASRRWLRQRSRSLIASVFSIAAGVQVTAFGQSVQARSTASAIEAPIVREYVDDQTVVAEDPVAELPRNVTIFGYETAVRSMLRWSPTFRRQCARLAAAEYLAVQVAPALQPGLPLDHTLTRIAFKPNGRMQAHAYIGSEGDPLELLGHEFEHILEQLDGVDLPSMARRPATGVYAVRVGGPFETRRALFAGRQVAREVREHRRDGQ
ncbi:MAG TPA: hypothetical protein VKE51_12550 [Vicinamibacterales bacterium]|nr:hypothetical protein [Vicinamibacterales bacterium]